jgi:hypothetical protein
MSTPMLSAARIEHLSPHDLVTYSRCPHEMELHRALHLSVVTGAPQLAKTPPDVVPLHQSPLFTPPLGHPKVFEGRYDVFAGDRLVYVDEGEDDLPVLFSPEQTALDPVFQQHGGTLHDDAFGLSGRPDLIVRTAAGALVPIEYKSTHLFVGYHEAHGRAFDAIQVIAECRLVEAVTGRRPSHGVVLYGDAAGDGMREGWVEVPYGDAEEHWLRAALAQIRGDTIRAPVPAERNCSGCEPNRLNLCPFAAARYHPNGTP